MQSLKRIINYYRDPGNSRRLAAALLLAPAYLSQLWSTLRSTFWLTFDSNGLPIHENALSDILILILSLSCLVPACWIYIRGVNKAPWVVRIAELMPAILVTVSPLVIRALYVKSAGF